MRRILCILGTLSCTLGSAGQRIFYPVSGDFIHCSTGAFSCYATVECPAGTIVWGGGGIGDQAKLESSYPIGGSGWGITFRGAFAEYASTAHANAQAVAVCSDVPSGYEFVSGPQTLCSHDGPSCTTTLACPPGKHVLAGGMFGTESQIESSYPSDAESWTVSWYPDREDFASPAIGGSIPYAICVDDPPDGFVQVLSESNNCDHDGPSCLTFAGCPDGTFVFGAAFYGYQSKVESFAPADPWSTIVTWYPASHEYASGADGIGIAIALCATGTYPINDPVFFNGFDP